MTSVFSRHTIILRQANLRSFLWHLLMSLLLNSEQYNQPTDSREFTPVKYIQSQESQLIALIF